MKTCQYCGEENHEDAILCHACGKELRQTVVVYIPRRVQNRPQLPPAPTEPELTLMVLTAQGLKPITLPFGDQLTLGRADREGQPKPAVDLTRFAGLELGVSRLHASIAYTGEIATIADLGSMNGTYLNGKKLKPHQAHILRYGDELYLAKLAIFIYTQ